MIQDTSREAAASIAATLGFLEDVVYGAIKRAGARGVTCDEVEVREALAHQTASARIRGLYLKGLVVESGKKRKTRSGRNAIVWTVP
jgi:hypothetical protein